MGGDGRPIEDDLCPVDKLFLNYNINVSTNSQERTGGWAKETYEIFRINNDVEVEEDSEELARMKLKVIIRFIESMRNHIEKDSMRSPDFKKVLIG